MPGFEASRATGGRKQKQRRTAPPCNTGHFMLIFARPPRTSTGRPPPRRTCRGRSKRQRPRGCAATGARPVRSHCQKRAHRDNATVHPSVTRRHCRVMPGGTRPVERQARTKVTRRARLGHARGARGSNRTGFMSEGRSAVGGATVRASPPASPFAQEGVPKQPRSTSSSRPTGARIVRR